jgi:hypothetical protein
LPFEVRDEEVIVRAIFSPYHVDIKKNRLERNAFNPYTETDEISVMRSSIIGPHRCKKKALQLENPDAKKVFRGFAVLHVGAVRAKSLQVVDSRKSNFLGHGDIKTGLVTPAKGVPRSPEEIERCKEICDMLIAQSTYYSDPAPNRPRWNGGRLIPVAGIG